LFPSVEKAFSSIAAKGGPQRCDKVRWKSNLL